MISSRYALPVAFLLILALIPTVIHTYSGTKFDDGKSVNEINVKLGDFTSEPSKRNAAWGKDIFDSQDWIERVYKNKNSPPLKFFAARSYNQKRLYHHPEIALSRGFDLSSDGLVTLKGNLDIPVYLYRGVNGVGLAAYALLYDDKFISDPISFQIRGSFRQMFAAEKMMTLFYISDVTIPKGKPFNESNSASILLAAINSFQQSKSKTQ